ncbi:MAG: 6,7-dimethyl-8-ribityllumazine synthase [Gammaproteobacteria bacterium]|nr:6,7-dimethyl-8-ribityllumazine synthase [Gammaproteobacteria bacterium]OUU12351.1 MAG: 6,7-dimethyl-8-ribityllumazine synthase [Gammaproteobacteria bacterium TMED34]|tara:strand:+ start:687 stop:1151 length:465 start_codon:yes stop_codon:yes gene_type:complete
MKTIEGDLTATTARFAIVAGRFNGFVVESMVTAAVDTLRRHGVDENSITLVRVPGAFELPIAVGKIIDQRNVDAVITLGAVIRGSTPHFEYVASQCASGIAAISRETGVPVSFGVLTTETIEQAIERAGTKMGNKGVDAAMTALEMVSLLRQLE